jgi:SPP1 gp7 family putative phage head morphogenesis protein
MALPIPRLPELLDEIDKELRFGTYVLPIFQQYERSYARVSAELDALRSAIASAPEVATITGSGTVSRGIRPSWILQHDRYTALQNELRALVVTQADTLSQTVPPEMRRAYELGLESAETLVGPLDPRLSASSFAAVPRGGYERWLAASREGSPIASLIESFRTETGASAAQYARDVLLNGLARGRNLAGVAAELEQGIRGMTRSRALTIARTETMRAHREGHFQSYRANAKVVEGWVWRAAVGNADPPPCAACFAMHGTEHSLDERMETHPNCRCRMIPKRAPFRGIEPTGPATRIRSGEDVFAELPARLQARILGPGKFRAYRDGNLRFDALGAYRSGPWGRTLGVRPMRSLGLTRQGRPIGQVPSTPRARRAPRAQAPAQAPIDWKAIEAELDKAQAAADKLKPPKAPPIPRSKLDAKIRGIEDEIVKNKKFETGVAFDDAGNIILDKRGASFQVKFEPEEIAILRQARATLTHNHPRAYAQGKLSTGDYVRGSSFSPDDVLFAHGNGLSRIRAVSHGWRHELEVSSSWTGSLDELSALRRSIDRADLAVRAEIQPELTRLATDLNKRRLELARQMPRRGDVPTVDYQAAFRQYETDLKLAENAYKDASVTLQFEHYHRVWERVSRDIGFSYTREIREY